MKVLLLSHSDSGGGGAIAAYRLANSLQSNGIDVMMGVCEKKTTNDFVFKMYPQHDYINRFKRKILRMFERFILSNFSSSNNVLHSMNMYSRIDITTIDESDYDIVHLHWINNNMISIKDISKISKPLIWTMHDCWPFCGAEHYPNILENDRRFEVGYTRDTKPKSTKGFDICRITFNRKKKYLAEKKIYFISPSLYEKQLLEKSALFAKSNCRVIPNIIDKSVFAKKDKNEARKLFNLPLDRKIIGFGAAYGVSNSKSIKGGHLLVEVLSKISEKEVSEKYNLLVFGKADDEFKKDACMDTFFSGYIENTSILSALYNCCDVFICPSIIENLPYTVLESISCGVPVAAFRIGGIPDIIIHKYNGYLAEPFNIDDLAKGVRYCMVNNSELSRNALIKSQECFNEDRAVRQMIELYEDVFDDKNITK